MWFHNSYSRALEIRAEQAPRSLPKISLSLWLALMDADTCCIGASVDGAGVACIALT